MPGFGLNRQQRREASAYIKAQSKRYGPELSPVPRDEWPDIPSQWTGPIAVLRSQTFLVSIYPEPLPLRARLSVIRSALSGNEWADRITWDELQSLKAQAGYADKLAVEIYPAEVDIVNVANMRHLWIYDDPLALSFVWRKKSNFQRG